MLLKKMVVLLFTALSLNPVRFINGAEAEERPLQGSEGATSLTPHTLQTNKSLN